MEIDKVIGRILDGYQPACVVMAANELKLFDQLKQPTTAEQAAKALNLDSEATERLLNSLTSLEIITKKTRPTTCQQPLTNTSRLAGAILFNNGFNSPPTFTKFGGSSLPL